MMKIGITGGIGSGKTTICRAFKLLGIPVFHADIEARQLQNSHPTIRREIIELLGERSYLSDQTLDRPYVASKVFTDRSLLDRLNEIVHPVVKEAFDTWCLAHTSAPYILYEAAILFESGRWDEFSKNILILADEQMRVSRVMKRDKTTEKAVRDRIANQLGDQEKIGLADFVIYNDGKQLVLPQLLEIDKQLMEYGKIR